MALTVSALRALMERAVDECIAHVDRGGLPFVGVVVDETGAISASGVNKVSETGDPSAHAEIVAMRDAMASHRLKNLAGTALLATGEPCGLCYRYAIERGVSAVYIALDRDAAAEWGFDYRASYPPMGISGEELDGLVHRLPLERGTEPFARYLRAETDRVDPSTQPSKGTP